MDNNTDTGSADAGSADDSVKTIDFSKGEWPELQGVQPGQKVPFEGEATVTIDKDGNGQIQIEDMKFQVDNSATRDLKNMTKQQDTGESASTDEEGGGF